MENNDMGRKPKSLLKELFLTGLTILTFGFIGYQTNQGIKEQDRMLKEEQTTLSQRESNGKITKIEIPAQEEIALAKSYAKKFLTYNEEKINPNLILERVKGNYDKLLYVDKNGIRILKLGEINPQLTRETLKFSKDYNINPKLMLTLAIIESKFGIDKKKSSAGATGPFQVMPANIKYYIKKNNIKKPIIESAFLLITDYAKALKIDISYNSKLTTYEIALITAAYNAGITNLKDKSEKIFLKPDWFLETKSYSLYALSALNHYNYDTGLKDKNGNIIIV